MAEHPERPKDLAAIKNTMERRAHLIVDLLEDRAQRIVDTLDEPPPGTEEQDPRLVRDMWNFSPFGERGPEVFWLLHDMALDKLLAEAAATPMPGSERMRALREAHQKAESAALSRAYPQRAELMLLGITTPERSVALAARAKRLVGQEDKRQGVAEMNPQQEVMAYG